MTRPTKEFDASVPERAALVAEEFATVLEKFGSEAGQYNVLGPDPWQVLWNDDRSWIRWFSRGSQMSARVAFTGGPTRGTRQAHGAFTRLRPQGRKAVFALVVNDATRSAGRRPRDGLDLDGQRELRRPHALVTGRYAATQGSLGHEPRCAKRSFSWREAFPTPMAWTARVSRGWKFDGKPNVERRTDSFLRTARLTSWRVSSLLCLRKIRRDHCLRRLHAHQSRRVGIFKTSCACPAHRAARSKAPWPTPLPRL